MKFLKDLGINEVGFSILHDQVFAITVVIAQGTIFKPFETGSKESILTPTLRVISTTRECQS
jgi:hypothetical protein